MKENNEKYFLYGLLVLVIIILMFVFSGFTLDTNKSTGKTINLQNSIETSDESSFKLISSGSTGPGEVAIDLKPHKVSNGQLQVDIGVNTHSVSLEEFDLKEITTFEFNGKSIKPISAPSLTGHHNSGTLVFDVGENIESFTIKIIGIPKVEERVFTWN